MLEPNILFKWLFFEKGTDHLYFSESSFFYDDL